MPYPIETTRIAYVQVAGTSIPVQTGSFQLLDGVTGQGGGASTGDWFAFTHVNGDRYFGPVSSIDVLIIDE